MNLNSQEYNWPSFKNDFSAEVYKKIMKKDDRPMLGILIDMIVWIWSYKPGATGFTRLTVMAAALSSFFFSRLDGSQRWSATYATKPKLVLLTYWDKKKGSNKIPRMIQVQGYIDHFNSLHLGFCYYGGVVALESAPE